MKHKDGQKYARHRLLFAAAVAALVLRRVDASPKNWAADIIGKGSSDILVFRVRRLFVTAKFPSCFFVDCRLAFSLYRLPTENAFGPSVLIR